MFTSYQLPTRKLTQVEHMQPKIQSTKVKKSDSKSSKLQVFKSSKWDGTNLASVEVKISEADSFNESESDWTK